ncbi:hypothetical protein PIGHUM_01995 [Pigmentiphaga humi]|uniref:Flagellar hook-length control protein FliK n=1 Tax=Pigmentiphaga humi TaxID=2478468 RepID=A0A3P4B2K7_9BURK|nr:flagellar hook-length control protein FliK [Pigmentiphaga humi]VCU69930.1 hypothetical protein PIGHUM_01995 [Pigmentiphaga humi]
MVADTRQTQAISGVAPTQSWERYREDAREAILARLLNVPGGGTPGGARASGGSALPNGLVRATVLQANSDTEALVDIGGKPYLVNTRQALSPGASIVLRLLDDRTFLQGQEQARRAGGAPAAAPGGVTDSEAADTAGRGNAVRALRGVAPIALPSLAELKVETGDTKVMLSGSARLLLALVDEIGGAQRSVPLAPLRLGADATAAEAAQRLQQGVAQSGLFYEAHLQEWREGRRELDTLRTEPQAALSPGPPAKEHAPAAAAPAALPAEPATPEQNAAKGLQAALDAIPPDVRQVVQDQIAVLASGRLFLQGAWAEQPFTLEIEPDDGQGRDAELPLSWRIRIAVQTRHLGTLQVDVTLAGTDARIAIQPDTHALRGQRLRDLQARLTGGGLDLQQALDGQGLRMTDLQVATASRSPARA